MTSQTAYVHHTLYQQFGERLVDEVKKIKAGDPLDPTTDVRTLIDEASAKRVESWIQQAVKDGAKLRIGGARRGAQIDPTVLSDVNPGMKVVCDEVFGLLVSVLPYDDLDQVCAQISESRFGLQCGIFTKSTATAIKAVRTIRTGGVVINGTSTWRTDQLAYGGVKDSGIGREGPKYAIRDMTEERIVIFNM